MVPIIGDENMEGEGEEVRWLHGVGGGRQKKERHGG
jgi:hypothetical protein